MARTKGRRERRGTCLTFEAGLYLTVRLPGDIDGVFARPPIASLFPQEPPVWDLLALICRFTSGFPDRFGLGGGSVHGFPLKVWLVNAASLIIHDVMNR